MKKNTCVKLILLFMSGALLFFYSASGWAAPEAAKAPTLNSSDCVKCHASQPADIDAKGGKHKTVSCQDCHASHRPVSKTNIPECNQCHQGQPHFEQKGCLGCHTNPHTPLAVVFSSPMTDPCLICHKPQITQLRENKSKHTALNCTNCHDVHRKVPECTKCHKPHSADMAQADCKTCHKAHMPKVVTYAAETESKFCGACHKQAFNLLTASPARHNTLKCSACHQEKHKMVPKCQDCHGDKHPAALMAKFPKCGECHKIAHDLNNWKTAVEPQAGAPKAAPKKKTN